jgi:UDP-N-acetylmuramoyl-tripeptide--D-alanyl-D-alanine ligase
MVELGPLEKDENFRLGVHAAQTCDHVVLVGARQTIPIRAGLESVGFPAHGLHVVETLEEVTAVLGRIAGQGDVVLFANDLPDSYLDLGTTSPVASG